MFNKKDTSRKTKQVIVMRKDLNMRKGKMIAQGSHSSNSFLVNAILKSLEHFDTQVEFPLAVANWISNGMSKICVYVSSEDELIDIYNKAKKSGLEVNLITDAGHTEFNGVPTKTCLAIGPDYEDLIDPITGHLKLL